MSSLARLHRQARSGYTLSELIVVLVIFGVVMTLAIGVTRGKAAPLLDDEVELMVRAMTLAKSEAIAEAGKVDYFFEYSVSEGPIVSSVISEANDTVLAPTNARREFIGQGYSYGTGTAIRGPIGDVVNPALPRPFTRITCTATNACDLGGLVVATYYIVADSNPDVMAAITISRNGMIRGYRYSPSNGSWY